MSLYIRIIKQTYYYWKPTDISYKLSEKWFHLDIVYNISSMSLHLALIVITKAAI